MNKPVKNQGISLRDIAFAGIFSYIAGVCSLPVTGIFSTLPAAAVCAVAASFLCGSRILIYILFGAMPLLLNCLYGFELSRGISLCIIFVAVSFFAILFKRAVITVKYSKANKKNSLQTKSTGVAIICVIALTVLWLFSTGNPVSALIIGSGNKKYVEEKYGEAVKSGYTYYDMAKKGYYTEIQFDGMEAGETYYVSQPEYDGYSEYCSELIFAGARDYFEGRTTLDADSVLCYADLTGVTVSPFDDYKTYLDRCEYLYEITSEIPGITGFKGIYENLSEYLALSDTFLYKSITVSGTDVDGNVYYAYLPYGGEVEFFYNDAAFEKVIAEKFGK